MMKKILQKSFEDHANVGQKKMLHAFSLIGVIILALSILSGCMWHPINQHISRPHLYDKNKTVTFTGALISPNGEVTIQAYDPQAKTWDDIAKTTSDDYIWPPGSNRYNWRAYKVIDAKFWARDQECASTGESAFVRSQWAGANLASFATPDMWDCRAENPNDNDFFANCKASESPKVLIPSVDYRNFGRECVDTINRIRSEEGKPPLQIYEAGECDADEDAKCDYEWELTNDGAHHCHHGSSWNECTYKSTEASVDDVLNGCLYERMYKEEQKCYENDPPSNLCGTLFDGCMASNATCNCGHYVAMVICPDYKKVSCGIYEVKDEYGRWRFKAVQNYYK